MKTITSVTVCARNKSRSNIYLDGEFYCSMDNLLVLKYGLKPEMQISPEALSEIQEENEFATAFDKALTYVSNSKKSKKQVVDYLIRKGYLYSLAIKVIKKLEEYGFVNDDDYARSFVQESAKTNGKMLIKMKLRAKGIDKDTAENAVDEIEDEAPSAKRLAQKYMRSKEITKENLAKCYRYLLSKGFSFDAAKDAIKSFGEVDDDY